MPRYTLELGEEITKDLDKYAAKKSISKAEAIKRALALLAIVNDEKASGNEVGIIRRDDNDQLQVVARIAGL